MSGVASATPPPPASPNVFGDKSSLLNSLGGASASAQPSMSSSSTVTASSPFHHQHHLSRMTSPSGLVVDDGSCVRPSVLSSNSAASTPRFGGHHQLPDDHTSEPRHHRVELHRRQHSNKSRYSSPSHDSDMVVKTLFKASAMASSSRANHVRHSSMASSSSATAAAAAASPDSDGQIDRVKLPVRLPTPHLTVVSDPYEDLPAHLRRHGLDDIARDWEVCHMTVDYALCHWMAAAGGSKVLLSLTNTFNARHDAHINAQLAAAAARAGKAPSSSSSSSSLASPVAPRHFTVPVADLDGEELLSGALPTHVLAVQSSLPTGRMDNEAAEPSMLVPAHAIPYTLQCVSLPSFAAGRSTRHLTGNDMDTDGSGDNDNVNTDNSSDDGSRKLYKLPVVSLRVPSPNHFPTTHRYIYSRDASALLGELLPMRHIVRHAAAIQRQQQGATPTPTPEGSAQRKGPSAGCAPLNAALAIQVLSLLPTATLLRHARIVHRVWSNGVALGLIDESYWATLDRAWDLLVAALACRKGRREDARLAETRQRLATARVC